ncbi:hypothetical protein ES288_A10G278800v1 [Gossypium darwinii]|uniref:Uncharacterized protein n=1 Tax=Gossypium darwinii TaxID=34276 RepID=A0A5D2F4Q6_GOSDA|nr:hypothetical protein ES288_A10G278800v1 [Gossypium darwinii]
MNIQSRKEFETTNAQGDVERKVETMDYSSSAGKGPEMKAVQVAHQHPPTNQKTSGGVLTGAAAAATLALESAKDAISRN